MARKVLGPLAFVLAVLVTASVPSFAKNSRKLHIPVDVVLNGKAIPAGDYQIAWEAHSPDATVSFSRKNTVLATGEGRILDRGKKYDHNAVVTETQPDGSNTLTEIRFAGSSEVIVFNSGSQAS